MSNSVVVKIEAQLLLNVCPLSVVFFLCPQDARLENTYASILGLVRKEPRFRACSLPAPLRLSVPCAALGHVRQLCPCTRHAQAPAHTPHSEVRALTHPSNHFAPRLRFLFSFSSQVGGVLGTFYVVTLGNLCLRYTKEEEARTKNRRAFVQRIIGDGEGISLAEKGWGDAGAAGGGDGAGGSGGAGDGGATKGTYGAMVRATPRATRPTPPCRLAFARASAIRARDSCASCCVQFAMIAHICHCCCFLHPIGESREVHR